MKRFAPVRRRAASCTLALLATALALAATALAPVAAQQEARTEIALGASHERVSRGLGDWSSLDLELSHRDGAGRSLQGGWRETRRFGLRDHEAGLAGSFALPTATPWTATLEATYSPTHRVLAHHTLSAQLQAALPAGWLVGLARRHNAYDAHATDLWIPGVEYYAGAWRYAYTGYAERIANGGSAVAHRLQAELGYADASRIGIGIAAGHEIESLGPALGTVAMRVRSVALVGRHVLTPAWAIDWEGLVHEQAAVYRRSGVHLGIRYRY